MTATHQLHLGDCVEWLRTLDDESVALAVTDPAYESLEKHRAKGTTTRLKQSDGSSNEWFSIFRNERFPDLMRELYRVLRRDSHLYVMGDEETTFDVTKPTGIAAGFTWWKGLVWPKTKTDIDAEAELAESDVAIGMGFHWRNSHEFVGFLEKGKRRLNNLGWASVLPAARVRNGYPTEKPVSLLSRLIENSSSPGELVIDPFMGSGSTGEAALRAGRRFAGCDMSQKSLDLARGRLAPLGVEGVVTTQRRQRGLW